MRKNITGFVFGILLVVAFVFAILVACKGRTNTVLDAGAQGESLAENSSATVTVTTATVAAGTDRAIQNAAAGYAFAMPSSWYIEKTGADGMTVYPDYDPAAASSSLPQCKIEISKFNTSADDLGDWVTDNLHADPTADVAEISRNDLQVDGAPALEWQGALNGVTTTLVYVAVANGVIEIAPSVLENVGSNPDTGADFTACEAEMQSLIQNFQIVK